jgi:hypothetical protein
VEIGLDIETLCTIQEKVKDKWVKRNAWGVAQWYWRLSKCFVLYSREVEEEIYICSSRLGLIKMEIGLDNGTLCTNQEKLKDKFMDSKNSCVSPFVAGRRTSVCMLWSQGGHRAGQ